MAAAARYYPDTLGNSAYYVSRCLRGGGIRYLYEEGCTQLYQVLVEREDVVCFHQNLDNSGYVTVEEAIKAVLKPGDVVMYYCGYCNITQNGPFLHTLIYMGTDEKGRMLGYSHNPWQSAEEAFHYRTTCYEEGCYAQLEDIFFCHFLAKEVDLPGEIVLTEIRGKARESFCYEKKVLICRDTQGRVIAKGRAAERQLTKEQLLCFYR